jgi:hypothetical protein
MAQRMKGCWLSWNEALRMDVNKNGNVSYPTYRVSDFPETFLRTKVGFTIYHQPTPPTPGANSPVGSGGHRAKAPTKCLSGSRAPRIEVGTAAAVWRTCCTTILAGWAPWL